MNKSLLFFVVLLCGFQSSFGQKLPFQNFSVDKGLIQSQVLCITQDNQHHLWLGTFGGIDRFDGTSFRHFSKNEGLNSSAVTSIYKAKNGSVWAGTLKGISCYDGYKVTNYPIQEKSGNLNIISIAEDENGALLALNFQKDLFVFKNNQFIKVATPFANAVPTCLLKDFKGRLLTVFYRKGVFVRKDESWQKFNETPNPDTTEFIVSLNNSAENYYAFTNKKRLLKFVNGVQLAAKSVTPAVITVSCTDTKGDIWTGTNNGVIVYSGKNLSVTGAYNAASGLSDNGVNCIYKDAEGNMWIGTDGDGLFKFSGGAFTKLDKSNGLPGNIVMGIVKDKQGNLMLGTREGGLIKYDLANKKTTPVDYSALGKEGINAMGADIDRNLFLGTLNGRLLKFDGSKFRQIFLDRKVNAFVNSIITDTDKTWFTTTSGCYYLKGDSVTKIKGLDEVAIGVLPNGKNETIVGSTNGIYLVSENNIATKVSVSELANTDVRCLARYHDFILVGTADEGIYFWNRQSGKIHKCTVRNGLWDNQVFSIFVDTKNNIWAGTGTGIQKIFFDGQTNSCTVQKFSKADGCGNAENNLNAITEDNNGAVWFGTTSGSLIFKQDTSLKNNVASFVVIQNVESPAFTADSSIKNRLSPWYHYPVSPVLPYNKNNISFSVKGIFFKDPGSIRYSYQLVGYDSAFSQPVSQTFFNYQSLEPGKYIFRVKAFTADGLPSVNIAEYTFTIATPYYKTTLFLFLLTGALILMGVMIQYLFSKAKHRRKKQVELIKHQEQQIIRQRTAEDFHDELGNKLTRISLLADILQKKTDPADGDKNNLVRQIKENVQALYTGTKDVIWSLSPGSDNFLEMLRRIEQFGNELFHDAEVQFSVTGMDEVNSTQKLPVDYSRNVLMIFKELLNNSLRHSGASVITVTVKHTGDNEFLITQKDNGTGFNTANITKGNGLNNIQRRAQRINAAVETTSSQNEGTVTVLKIKIPSNG